MIIFKTEKILAKIGETGTSEKRLTLTGWNERPAKLDLRLWRTDGSAAQPGKGITLSDAEAYLLLTALQSYFEGKEHADGETAEILR